MVYYRGVWIAQRAQSIHNGLSVSITWVKSIIYSVVLESIADAKQCCFLEKIRGYVLQGFRFSDISRI